jgi:DNA-binding NtrC family response regulator
MGGDYLTFVSSIDPDRVHVLVVEDNEDARDLFVIFLERAGFFVSSVPSVEAARALLATARIDVLVADYSLEGATGGYLLQGLSSSSHPRACVLVTGFSAHDVDSTGFHAVLTKPIDDQKLVRTIRSLLEPV